VVFVGAIALDDLKRIQAMRAIARTAATEINAITAGPGR